MDMNFNSNSFSNPTGLGVLNDDLVQNTFNQNPNSFSLNSLNNRNVLTTPGIMTPNNQFHTNNQYVPSTPIRAHGQIGLTYGVWTPYHLRTTHRPTSYINQFYTNNQYVPSTPIRAQGQISHSSGVTTPYNPIFPSVHARTIVDCQYPLSNNNQSSLAEVTVTKVETTKFLTTASTANCLLSFSNRLSQGNNVTSNGSNSIHLSQSLQDNSYNYPQNVVPYNHQSIMPYTSNSNFNPINNHVDLNPVSRLDNNPFSTNQEQKVSNPVPNVQRVYDLASLIDVTAYNKSMPKQEVLNPEPTNVLRPMKRHRFGDGASSSQVNGGTSQQIIAVDGYGSYDNVLGNDGRLHSLPHPKYGPYTCPICKKIFSVSQHFATHTLSHYKYETPEQKKGRMMVRNGVGNLHMTNTIGGVPDCPGNAKIPEVLRGETVSPENGAIVLWEGAFSGESSAAGGGTGGVIVKTEGELQVLEQDAAGEGTSSYGVQIKQEPRFAPFN